jgi:hypothetical protein
LDAVRIAGALHVLLAGVQGDAEVREDERRANCAEMDAPLEEVTASMFPNSAIALVHEVGRL